MQLCHELRVRHRAFSFIAVAARSNLILWRVSLITYQRARHLVVDLQDAHRDVLVKFDLAVGASKFMEAKETPALNFFSHRSLQHAMSPMLLLPQASRQCSLSAVVLSISVLPRPPIRRIFGVP